jgi:hypothetical protein
MLLWSVVADAAVSGKAGHEIFHALILGGATKEMMHVPSKCPASLMREECPLETHQPPP